MLLPNEPRDFVQYSHPGHHVLLIKYYILLSLNRMDMKLSPRKLDFCWFPCAVAISRV